MIRNRKKDESCRGDGKVLLCRVSKAASSSVSTSFKEGQLHFFAAFYRLVHTDKQRQKNMHIPTAVPICL